MIYISKLRYYEIILFHYLFTNSNSGSKILYFKNKSSQSKWYYILMVMTVISTTRLSKMNLKRNTGNSDDSCYGEN